MFGTSTALLILLPRSGQWILGEFVGHVPSGDMLSGYRRELLGLGEIQGS